MIRTRGPRRQRLTCGDLGDVDHVTAVVHHHDACLSEERINCLIRSMPEPTAYPGMIIPASTSGGKDDNGLLPSQVPGDPRELPGITDRIEGEQADSGWFVVLPVLHDIVRGDVGVVARADEGRQAHIVTYGVVQQAPPRRRPIGRTTPLPRPAASVPVCRSVAPSAAC